MNVRMDGLAVLMKALNDKQEARSEFVVPAKL